VAAKLLLVSVPCECPSLWASPQLGVLPRRDSARSLLLVLFDPILSAPSPRRSPSPTKITAHLRAQDFAFEPEQKYKEGRFILEREMISERPEGKMPAAGSKPRIEELPMRELLARV
jgi:hypothetical protein